jgi:hypothetical protein
MQRRLGEALERRYNETRFLLLDALNLVHKPTQQPGVSHIMNQGSSGTQHSEQLRASHAMAAVSLLGKANWLTGFCPCEAG